MNYFKNFIQLTCLLLISLCAKHVDSNECGYRSVQKNHELINLSNTLLRQFGNMGNVTRLKSIFHHFNRERVVGTQQHRAVREYIRNTLRSLGWSVYKDGFSQNTPNGVKDFVNVMASSNPDAPYRLILACHYDSKDFGGDFVFIGAVDSAVPCAILIDIAKTLTSSLQNVRNLSLDLVFFDGEEAFGEWTKSNSIYGAKHLAQRWKDESATKLSQTYGGHCTRLDSINALVLLDLIGEKGLKLNNLYRDNSYSTALFENFKNAETRLRNLRVIDTRVERIFTDYVFYNGGEVEDDHLPFKEEGVNIVHLIAVPFPSVWHTKNDNAQALDWKTINYFNAIVRVFVASYFNLQP